MFSAFLIGAVIAAVVGLPVDYVWRRYGRVGVVAGAVNAVALIALVAGAISVGVVHGPLAVVAFVFGLVAGSSMANHAATRLWGLPAHRW
jgi:ABC-type transport system involved in cytochrome c biogenesis permease subunit